MPHITQRPDKPFLRLLVLTDDECAFACATGADRRSINPRATAGPS
jgi:hypothetical protein